MLPRTHRRPYTTPEEREGHLGEFLPGAQAFVSNDAYLKIRGKHLTEANFNVWGAGSNFVAPLADADKLVEAASAEGGRGLFQLEEELGIPKLFWVDQCKSADYGIWRFKILKPEALNLRIPSGGEYGAYGSWVKEGVAHRGEWRPGGRTLGGGQGGRDRPGRRRQVWRIGRGCWSGHAQPAGGAREGRDPQDRARQVHERSNTKRALQQMGQPG